MGSSKSEISNDILEAYPYIAGWNRSGRRRGDRLPERVPRKAPGRARRGCRRRERRAFVVLWATLRRRSRCRERRNSRRPARRRWWSRMGARRRRRTRRALMLPLRLSRRRCAVAKARGAREGERGLAQSRCCCNRVAHSHDPRAEHNYAIHSTIGYYLKDSHLEKESGWKSEKTGKI